MVGCRYKQSTKAFFTQLFQQTTIPKAAPWASVTFTFLVGNTKRSSHNLWLPHPCRVGIKPDFKKPVWVSSAWFSQKRINGYQTVWYPGWYLHSGYQFTEN
jgi:hypothetical protein